MAYDVFISHSSKDKAVADAVTAALEQAKVRCWIAPRDIRPGDSWGGAIVEAIETCKVMVVVFSSRSNASKQVMREVERAVQHDIVVVPFRIEDVTPTRDMEYFLSSTHWLDAVTPEMDNHLNELTITVNSILEKPSETQVAKKATPMKESIPEDNVAGKRKTSKLPIIISGLALTFVLGFLSFSLLIGPSNDNDKKQKDSHQTAAAKTTGDITMSLPASAKAGTVIKIEFDGNTNPKDSVLIAKIDAADHLRSGAIKLQNASVLDYQLSSQTGDFEARYIDSVSRKIIARQALKVFSPRISLEAPLRAQAGSSIQVNWSGPNHRGDYLSIAGANQADNKYQTYAYISKGSPTSIRLPDQSGEYELRYISGNGGVKWSSKAITVNSPQVSIEEIAPQIAGAEITVNWEGPANKGDYLSVANIGAPDKEYFSYRYAKAGQAAKLRLPALQGNYEVRYISGQNNLVWAKVDIEVIAAEVSMQVPGSGTVGQGLSIEWEGPGHKGDYLTVAEPNSSGNKYISYKYVKPGTPTQLQLPQEPGSYVIRYISAAKDTVWFEKTIEVLNRDVQLTAKSEAVIGEKINVAWNGKGQRGEYIGVYQKSDSDDARYKSYAYTNAKENTKLKMPTEPGSYEIRYISGSKKIVWGRSPILIK